METFLIVGKAVLMVLGGLVVILKLVAPLTETRLDNKLLKVFTKAQSFLQKLVG